MRETGAAPVKRSRLQYRRTVEGEVAVVAICILVGHALVDEVVGRVDIAPGAVIKVDAGAVARAHRRRRWGWRRGERRVGSVGDCKALRVSDER